MAIAIRRPPSAVNINHEVIIILSSAVISHSAASRLAGAEDIAVTFWIVFFLFHVILRQLVVCCTFFVRTPLRNCMLVHEIYQRSVVSTKCFSKSAAKYLNKFLSRIKHNFEYISNKYENFLLGSYRSKIIFRRCRLCTICYRDISHARYSPKCLY